MSVFGNSAPLIKLIHADINNAMTVISSITCPTPQRRSHDYKEEIKVIKNYEGTILRQEVNYRFWTALRFIQLSESDFANLARTASWNEIILFYPSSGVTYYAEQVKILSFHPFHDNDKVNYDGLDIEFQGVNTRPKIVTPDNLILAMQRTSVQ